MLWHIFKYLTTLVVVALSSPLTAAQNVVLVEGDILQSADSAGLVANKLTGRAVGVGNSNQLWPAGIIPYSLDPALPEASRAAINLAIEHWNEVGGISLLPLSQAAELLPDGVVDSVKFIAGDFCASWVGRRGGEQNLWVAPYCPAGSVMHEIGHVLGLEHEHTRPDRDQHIDIHWENIEVDKHHNFDVAPVGTRLLGEYDHDSIMHYGTHNFSVNGQATISSVDGLPHRMGQRVAPSAGDLTAVATLYGSDLSLVVQSDATNSGDELDVYVTNQNGRGAHDVSVQLEVAAHRATVISRNGWACFGSAEGFLNCNLGLLPGSATTHLVLGLPESISTEGIEVSLTSKTPDYDLSNNVSRVLSDDVALAPDSEPFVVPLSGPEDKPTLQDDVQPEVVTTSGGAISLQTLAWLLILVGGKASSRIDRKLILNVFGVHRG